MVSTLSPLQRRVLGVLIEKSLTQHATYPLTLNAIVVGCNQKSNRDPVLQAGEGDVASVLYELQQYGAASQAAPGPGTRANRFQHDAQQAFGWSTPERAIMAELLLRGPQTPGELRNRASRMAPLESVGYVLELLGELGRHDPPFVRELPRGPGQSATRFTHTLYPDDEPIPTAGPIVLDAPRTDVASSARPNDLAALMERVEVLEAAVSELRAELESSRESAGGDPE
ncbi:MAG: DUF480 domain-containing protein [Phycisphaerae bacterium]